MLIVRNKAKAVLFALCLCLASICHAIGFGDLKVYSYLNEPLVAEISLTGFKDMDPGLLKASLADAKDFVRAGIDRPYFLTYLVFEILKYQDQLLIVVRTSKPVQVPYLEFLVELSWPDGNLIKDYTVLLDPPPPSLSKETRPKSLSEIAMQSRGKNFGPDAIQVQLDKQKAEQQRAAAAEDLSGVVKLAPNSFSDNTFDSELPQKDTPLVPSEVPDIDEAEQAALEAKAAQQAAQKAAQAATEAAYQKQLATFKQEQQQKAAAAAKEKSSTILSRVVDKLEDFNTEVAESTPESALPPAQTTQPPVESTVSPAEEPIDFQNVLPPIPPPVTAAPPATAIPAEPAPPAAPPAFQPPTDVKPVPETSNHLYLGIILSLLLIAAGIAIAVKRMHYVKSQHTQEPDSDVEATTSEFEEFSMHEDSVVEDVKYEAPPEEPEEIELTSPVGASALSENESNTDEPNKFDRDFNKIDFTELATPVIEDDPIAPAASRASTVPMAPTIPMTPVLPVEAVTTTSPVTPGLVDLDHPSPIAEEDTITIEPPTMFKTSELKLEPEGATLIKPLTSVIDNSEAVQIKIDLAKEYLDTGDKESAKELLQEVIEIANDSQRLEAQMLLSGIV
jgi:FimV-like protein